MQDRTIIINNTPIEKGQQTTIEFNVARLPTHTTIELPVYVYRAREEGPVLLLTATLHGDELNGMEIIRRMRVEQTIQPQRGTVIAIPILNIFGFLQNSRTFPGGKDLNRSFPGSQNGSLAQRVAYILIHEILPHVDFGIDFHTGGLNRSNYPQVRSVVTQEENRLLAQSFAAPFIVNSKLRDKSFRKEAEKRNKIILVYEGGEAMRFDEFAIQEGINGTLRVMEFLGMREGSPEANRTIWMKTSRWIRAGYGGIYHPLVHEGESVKKRQVIATITDPFGDFEYKVRTGESGHVIGLSHLPVVHKGDALIHLGVE